MTALDLLNVVEVPRRAWQGTDQLEVTGPDPLIPARGASGRRCRRVEASRRRSFDHRLVQTERMLHLRICSPAAMSDAVIRALSDDPAVSSLAVLPGASVRPAGDVVLADVAREAANDVVDRLRALELHREGSLDIDHVRAWLSQRGLDAEQLAPGSSADSVVWVDVTHQAYAESEFNWTYVSFMTMATLIAGIAIILDSQILVIGAMVLGPEFGAVAALGVALVRGRLTLLGGARRQSAWLGDARGCGRTTARDCVHLRTGQVVVHRRRHRRGGRCFVADFSSRRRPDRGVHLGYHRAGGWERCLGPRLRR